jgi:hypothetical protein
VGRRITVRVTARLRHRGSSATFSVARAPVRR